MSMEIISRDGGTIEEKPIARLNLSGEEFVVGTSCTANDHCPYIQAYGQDEPTYMSILEARMLITALEVAIATSEGKN